MTKRELDTGVRRDTGSMGVYLESKFDWEDSIDAYKVREKRQKLYSNKRE